MLEKKYSFAAGFLVTILYGVLTILLFYPCLGLFSNSLIGPPEDNMVNFWNMWWAKKVITQNFGSLEFSNYIFYPEGSSLLFHSYSFLNIFLSIMMPQSLSPALVYNLSIFFSFVLSGLGAFLLIKYLTADSYVSFIGGFIFAFSPYHFVHSLHHINLSSIQFIPFFVLFFLKSLNGNSKKDLFLACSFFFINAISSWYYLVMTIFFIFFYYIYLIFKTKRIIILNAIIKIGSIIGATLLILSPWLIKMVMFGLRNPGINYGGHDTFVVDLFALIIPHQQHSLSFFNLFSTINSRFTGNPWEATAYLGIVNIIIVILSFKEIIKKKKFYFFGLIFFLILSMGTRIHVLGKTVPIILPFEIIKKIPLLSVMRVPSRNIVFVYLFLAILVAFSLKHLFGRLNFSLTKTKLIIFSTSLLLFIDYFSPCTIMTKLYLPDAYKSVEASEQKYGLLDLPQYDYSDSARYMMFQTFHQIPICSGYIARKPNTSLIDRLEFKDLTRQKEQLTRNNVKYIIIHKKLLKTIPHSFGYLLRYKANYELIYEDEGEAVFVVF